MTQPIPHGGEPVDPETELPWSALRDTGLLWLVNRVVFHPRGYALAIYYSEGGLAHGGTATGWGLLGDGSEPWSMGDPPPDLQAQGHPTEDELFARVQRLLTPRSKVKAPPVAEAPPGAPEMFWEGG